MSRIAALCALIFGLAAALAQAQSGPLIVQEAWTRKAPGSNVAAVYLTLRNTSAQPVILVGVRSPAASNVMVHETTVKNGQSQMRPKERVVIAPGQSVTFSPGGLHIMLQGLKSQYTVGQSVPLILLLANGEQIQVAAVVRPLDAR